MKLIHSQPDDSGEMIDIWQSQSLSLCPAMSLFLKVYAEIIDKGYANPVVNWNNKNRVVWAEKQSSIIGGIAYDYMADQRCGWIVLSFTMPTERGRGINQILHNHMEKDLLDLGADSIASLVHVDNLSRQKSAAKVGMQPQYIRTVKAL